MNRTILRSCFLLILCSYCGFSQNNLQGFIKDSKTKEPVSYCAISIKNTSKGCLSNEEGIFQISANVETDTLLIQYIGYVKRQIAVKEFVKDPILFIQSKEISLKEVVVSGNNDYFYSLFDNCREKLLIAKQRESKVYYVLETELAKQPVELLECYYNGSFNNSVVKDIAFKNGRVGIASYNGRFFMSQNISKAFTFLNLTNAVAHLPAIPFQFTKRKLKKNYKIILVSVNDQENPLYHFRFLPNDTASGEFFGGEAWIEKNTGDLKKLNLKIYNTTTHPFLPIFKEFGEIKNVSMQITKTFTDQEDENVLSHIDFNYQLNYHHIHSATLMNKNVDTSFVVNSKGVMYFYDYNKPFILPHFSYDSELSDYIKITSLTYNESFWKNNTNLVYSEKMKKGINYFKANGQLINYKSRSINRSAGFGKKQPLAYETNYIEWSDKKRISLKKNNIKNDTANKSGGETFLISRYTLKGQIFLDLNQVGDSIQHHSQSVFDLYQTYYNIPEEHYTNCFMNIYFDLVEIHRRQMEKEISKKKLTVEEFNALYETANKRMNEETALYFKEVERGKNTKALEKWNEVVYKNIGINNLEIFEAQKGKKIDI